MQSITSHPGLLTRTSSLFRVCVVVLAALAVAVSGQPVTERLLVVGAAYPAIAGLVWVLAPRLNARWLVYPLAFVDVAAISALLWLAPATDPPLWTLFLFPIAAAAAVGRVPAAVAASLSGVGYVGANWLTAGALVPRVVWPLAALAAAAFAVAYLATRWRAEQEEKRAWQELAVSGRGLSGEGEPNDIAEIVSERARRLMRATRAQLWWCDHTDQVRPGLLAGGPSDEPFRSDALTPELARQLERGPVPLTAFGMAAEGELVALRYGGTLLALLAVTWANTPSDRLARRERLRAYSPWAAAALAQAQARAAAREQLRREQVLRQAAADLAATLDPQAVYERAVEAARSVTGAPVALVVWPSRRLLRGDAALAAPPGPETTTTEQAAGGAPSPAPAAPHGLHLVPLGGELALLAQPPIEEATAAWLRELAALVRGALDRCATYAALQRDAQRLSASLDALPAPVAVWTVGGALVLANAAYRALGPDGAPPIGLPSAGPLEEELRLGEPARTFAVTTLPLGDGAHVVAQYREITREREALRAKEHLISVVGHELRTPLTTIYAYSQRMARELGTVQQQVGQLSDLIRDFVDASRLESGELPLAHEAVDLRDLARAVAERFRGTHEGRRLRLDVAEVLPVEGDPARLGQVLDNLLSNAAKYSAAESEIVLTVRPDEGQVVLSVQDQGAGIAPDQLPRVFDRFYRIPGESTQKAEGFGLGLSIVRDLVTAHGGRIWAESAGEGRGSTFSVVLPTARPSQMTGAVAGPAVA